MKALIIEDEPFAQRSDRVTVIAPGVGTEVEAGSSVRETLANAGIFPTLHQLVRLGREEVHNLERVVEAGEVLTVVNKVRAGR